MDEDYYESDSGNTAVQNYDRTAIPDPSQPSGYRNDVAPQLNAYQAWNPQAPQLNIPSGEVDWDYVNRAVSAHRQSEALQMQRKTYEAKINQAAVRERGRLKMQQLIEGGATPQEAYRLAGGDLHFQDPEAYASGMLRLNDQMNKPEIREAGGVVWERNKAGKWDAMTPLKPKGSGVPPIMNKQLSEAISNLNRINGLILKAEKPEEIAPLKDEQTIWNSKKNKILSTLKEQGFEVIDDPEIKEVVTKEPDTRSGITKFFGLNEPKSTTNRVPVYPPSLDFKPSIDSETVKVIRKDGKPGTIPKSKLEAALKAGFKLAE